MNYLGEVTVKILGEPGEVMSFEEALELGLVEFNSVAPSDEEKPLFLNDPDEIR